MELPESRVTSTSETPCPQPERQTLSDVSTSQANAVEQQTNPRNNTKNRILPYSLKGIPGDQNAASGIIHNNERASHFVIQALFLGGERSHQGPVKQSESRSSRALPLSKADVVDEVTDYAIADGAPDARWTPQRVQNSAVSLPSGSHCGQNMFSPD